MTEYDLTDKDIQIISSRLGHCSRLIELDDTSKFAKKCKQGNITVKNMKDLENKITTQNDERNYRWEMTDIDLTDKDIQIIISILRYCSELQFLDDRLAEDLKQKHMTFDNVIQLENKITTQTEKR
jgi:hypothetical protein